MRAASLLLSLFAFIPLGCISGVKPLATDDMAAFDGSNDEHPMSRRFQFSSKWLWVAMFVMAAFLGTVGFWVQNCEHAPTGGPLAESPAVTESPQPVYPSTGIAPDARDIVFIQEDEEGSDIATASWQRIRLWSKKVSGLGLSVDPPRSGCRATNSLMSHYRRGYDGGMASNPLRRRIKSVFICFAAWVAFSTDAVAQPQPKAAAAFLCALGFGVIGLTVYCLGHRRPSVILLTIQVVLAVIGMTLAIAA